MIVDAHHRKAVDKHYAKKTAQFGWRATVLQFCETLEGLIVVVDQTFRNGGLFNLSLAFMGERINFAVRTTSIFNPLVPAATGGDCLRALLPLAVHCFVRTLNFST